jgi:hypothetical protein
MNEMPAGRPSKYKPEFCEQAFRLCLLGLTDKELSAFFCVSESTFNLWKLEHDEFSESIKNGRENADAKVVESLYKRACGYSHPEDKIFNNNGEALIVPTVKHYPPDTASAIFLLCNRQRLHWKNTLRIDDNGQEPGNRNPQEVEALTGAMDALAPASGAK